MFRIIISSRVEREFAKLSKKLKQKFYKEFEKLSINPFSHRGVKKIQNTEFGYRLRIGRWRILFALFQKEKRIKIVDIFLRKGKEDYPKKRKLIR